MTLSSLAQVECTQPLSVGIKAYRILTQRDVTEDQCAELVDVVLACDNPRLSLWLLEDVGDIAIRDQERLLRHISLSEDSDTARRALRTVPSLGQFRRDLELLAAPH